MRGSRARGCVLCVGIGDDAVGWRPRSVGRPTDTTERWTDLRMIGVKFVKFQIPFFHLVIQITTFQEAHLFRVVPG